jgi:hypothetical protein
VVVSKRLRERAWRVVRHVEERAAVVAPEPQPCQVEIALAGADDRVGQADLGVLALGAVIQDLERKCPRPAMSVARIEEAGEALAGQHLAVVQGLVLQLTGLGRAGIGEAEGLVDAQQVVGGDGGQALDRAPCRRAAIVGAHEQVGRLLRDLHHQDRGADQTRMRLDGVLELEARQIAGEQQVALDDADIGGPRGGDLGRIVGEKIAILVELGRPFDLLDIALHHLDADVGAVGIELLRRDDGAREHVAVGAVFGGDLARELVDLLEGDGLSDQVGIELGELRGGVDGRADDGDLADAQPGLGRARRRLDPGLRDDGSAGLRQWTRGRLESEALPARQIAGRNDLRNGSKRHADHR